MIYPTPEQGLYALTVLQVLTLGWICRVDIRAWGLVRGLYHGVRRSPVRLVISFCVGIVLFVGGTKEPGSQTTRLAQFITALADGRVIDDSGVVARYTEQEAYRFYNLEISNIIAGAHSSITGSIAGIYQLRDNLTNHPYLCAYISAYLPRADPQQWTNHNIAATVQAVSQSADGSRINLFVWFSETPALAPDVSFAATVTEGVWVRLTAVTNSFPTTIAINGIPCVLYSCEMPAGMRGVPLRPEYELTFGGYNSNDYLVVKSAGVTVETNGVVRLPYTGWWRAWPAPWGTNLEVRYNAGIAVEAIYMGTNYTGVNL